MLFRRYQEAKRLRPYKTCALMMDLRGRSVRISKCKKPIQFFRDDVFEVRTDGCDIESTAQELQINYFDLPTVMREGDVIILGTDNG